MAETLENIKLQIKVNGNSEELIPYETELGKGEPYYDQVSNKLYVGNGNSGESTKLNPVNGVTCDSGKIFGYDVSGNTISKTKKLSNTVNNKFELGDIDDSNKDSGYVFKLAKENGEVIASLDWEGRLTGTYSIKGLTATEAEKLTVNGGSTTKPVYFTNGKPKACSGWLPTKINNVDAAPGGDNSEIFAPTKAEMAENKSKYIKVNADGNKLEYTSTAGTVKEHLDRYASHPMLCWDLTSQQITEARVKSENGVTYDVESRGRTLSVIGGIKATDAIQGKSFNAKSDARLKENITPFEATTPISDLPIYSFNYKNDESKEKQIGILAQDLQNICPELVKENEDGYLSIKESKLIYLLMNEVKELRKEVEELRNGRQE